MSAFRSDHQLVRDYVTAMDHLQYTQLPEGIVAILLTHSNLDASHLDIETVKEKFRKHIGTPIEHQRLILKEQGQVVCEMFDNTKMLGFYSVRSGMEIHIIDTDPFSLSRGGGLTDVSLVEKYRMADEDYDKRKNSMRQYIRDQRSKDPNFKLKPKSGPTSEPAQPVEIPGVESIEGITVGARCEVMPGSRRGTVQFVGEHPKMTAGYWVGVRLDEPLGRSDGVVKGEKIFDCEANFGAFVRGKNIRIGDFKVRDLMDSDDEGEPGGGVKCCEHDECDDDEEEI